MPASGSESHADAPVYPPIRECATGTLQAAIESGGCTCTARGGTSEAPEAEAGSEHRTGAAAPRHGPESLENP